MKQTRILMGMPITVEIVDRNIKEKNFNSIFDYFSYVDKTFSTYKENSEITRLNKSSIAKENLSRDVKEVLLLCEETKQETGGYFDIGKKGYLDPSGLVKGWSILNAGKLLKRMGYLNFYIDAGGDIQATGKNSNGENWRIGIRNPFNRYENIKIINLTNMGIATSGTAIRGQHIYNPFKPNEKIDDIVSLTVIGPDVYEADRFATAAFAMGKEGINFIENKKGFEGYLIDNKRIATMTSGFAKFVL